MARISRGRSVAIIFVTIAFAVTGIFLILLYAMPNFRPMGLSGVFIQGKYMTYVGPHLDYIFEQNNIIIESDTAEINIRVRKDDQMDKGYAQVFEDSNGIAFNSVNRVQLDFFESTDPKTGEFYVKIKVREPKGAMVSKKARVFVNLKSEHLLANYKFILNTNKSNVTFDADASAAELSIKKIDINGTGRVEFKQPTKTSIETMNITSTSANVNCTAPVRDVTIKGMAKSVSLGEVLNDLTVSESVSNVVNAEKIGGNVKINGQNIRLNVRQLVSGNVNIESNEINLTLGRVDGNVTLTGMREDGFINGGSIRVNGIGGNTYVRMEKGSLTLGAENAGVFGNVDVEKRYGGMNVKYADNSAATGGIIARVYDGTVDVSGIRGLCDIVTTSYGNANVNVKFAALHEHSKILIEGSREPAKYGKIVVTFLAGAGNVVPESSFYVIGSSGFKSMGSTTELLNSNPTTGVYNVYKISGQYNSPSLSGPATNLEGALQIKTANIVEIKTGR